MNLLFNLKGIGVVLSAVVMVGVPGCVWKNCLIFNVRSNLNISISKSNGFSLLVGQKDRPLDKSLDSPLVMAREERLITGHVWIPVVRCCEEVVQIVLLMPLLDLRFH